MEMHARERVHLDLCILNVWSGNRILSIKIKAHPAKLRIPVVLNRNYILDRNACFMAQHSIC